MAKTKFDFDEIKLAFFVTSLSNFEEIKKSFIKPISLAYFAVIVYPVRSISIDLFLLTFLLKATIGVLQNNPILTPGVAKIALLSL